MTDDISFSIERNNKILPSHEAHSNYFGGRTCLVRVAEHGHGVQQVGALLHVERLRVSADVVGQGPEQRRGAALLGGQGAHHLHTHSVNTP